MNITQARLIGNALLAAAATAEHEGRTEIGALDELRALDDAARSELQAAIDRSAVEGGEAAGG